jgi:hypothetical protein
MSTRRPIANGKSNYCHPLVLIGIPILLVQILVLNQLAGRPGNVKNDISAQSTALKDFKAGSQVVKPSNDPVVPTFKDRKQHGGIGRKKKSPDATFNGYPVYYHEKHDNSTYSQVHCVGEMYGGAQGKDKNKVDDWTWMHRSCHFEFFCFDVQTKEFLLYQDPKEQSMLETFKERPFLDVSQSFILNHTTSVVSTSLKTGKHTSTAASFGVSLGGINRKWGMRENGNLRLKWFPRIVHEPPPTNFYTLPEHVVMAPFHSLSAFNPGHLVWDDFLPLFTLLQMFQLDNKDTSLFPRHEEDNNNTQQQQQQHEPYELLMMRYVVPNMWASCDWKIGRTRDCAFMLKKFGPLMTPGKIVTHVDSQLNVSTTGPRLKSNLVCARHGVAGIGDLTDHGTQKGHGFEPKDYELTHNDGRGGQMWDFRNFMMTNVGLMGGAVGVDATRDNPPRQIHKRDPLLILFSINSSEKVSRRLSFDDQIRTLQLAFNEELHPSRDLKKVVVESHQFSHYSIKKQADIVSKAAIYVTGCGGGAVTATFLPRGSSLFLFYHPFGGLKNNQYTHLPARLDWDLFNQLSYVRVHWIPVTFMHTPEDLKALVELVKHELLIIQRDYSFNL